MVRTIAEQLLKDGAVHRGYLGVRIKDLNPEVAARLGVEKQKGMLVAQVFAGSPAAKAGLKDGINLFKRLDLGIGPWTMTPQGTD